MKQFMVVVETRAKSCNYFDDFDNYEDAVARVKYLDRVATKQANDKVDTKFVITNITLIDVKKGALPLDFLLE